jgi:chitin-binding protein
VENHGHGDADAHTSAEPAAAEDAKDAKDAEDAKDTGDTGETGPAAGANRPKAAAAGQSLAETGGDARTAYVAMGGAATLALGSAVLFLTARRRSAGGARHGR